MGPVDEDGEATTIPSISFADFLVTTPPNKGCVIDHIAEWQWHQGTNKRLVLNPDIELHCSSEKCGGIRVFRTQSRITVNTDKAHDLHITYTCSNCQEKNKVYSLRLYVNDDAELSGGCLKYGEEPIFGTPTPARLLRLVQPDKDDFLKGRRCENQGLGIGAFAYYRRVIERQRTRIIDEIHKVAVKVNASSDVLEALNKAKEDWKFTSSVDSIKAAIPHALLINGQNPLVLLHNALSEGLHAKTDEQCLEIAQAIRIVMVELSDRLGQLLKDEAELSSAVKRLQSHKGV